MTTARTSQATTEADPDLPIILSRRDFTATPEQVMRAHIEPDGLDGVAVEALVALVGDDRYRGEAAGRRQRPLRQVGVQPQALPPGHW